MVYVIQILRGVAALLVMLFHYSHYLKAIVPGQDIGFRLFGGGIGSVDIFMILSGFIIVHSTRRPEHSRPLEFSIRRLFRVVPLAQIATLAYFLIISAKPTFKLLFQSLFFLPSLDSDPPKFGYPVVPQEWTLSYELIFYAIFAATLVFTHRHRVVGASILIVAFVFGFQWCLGGPISLHPNAVYLPHQYSGPISPEIIGLLGNPLLLDFVAGMFLAVAYGPIANARAPSWLRWGFRGVGVGTSRRLPF